MTPRAAFSTLMPNGMLSIVTKTQTSMAARRALCWKGGMSLSGTETVGISMKKSYTSRHGYKTEIGSTSTVVRRRISGRVARTV